VADKFEVARALREIALLLEVDGANPFKVKAYERGARAVSVLREDVTELARANRLTEVPGIGANLAATIAEIATTGKSQQLEKLKSRLPPGILELAPVLSLQKVKTLHEALGISTLDDLRAAAESGRLRGVKGFGVKTEQKVLEAIRRVGERVEETLLYEATREAEGVLEHLRASPAVEAAEVGGALRRRCETVTRIDVVVAAKKPEAALEHALAFPLITNVVERGDRVASGRLAAGVALAVEAVRPARFAAALHRSTGSDAHRARLFALAEERGFRLGDEGLSKNGRRVPVATEEGLYERLGLPFIPPELREDAGEIEAALAGDTFADLVGTDDVRGLVHCHTLYSDGKHSVEEMAKGADALGMDYLTITDHSPTASYAGGLPLDRLKRQWEDIERAQEKVKVKLLRGTESDILADGSLDYPDAVLEKLDVIIASVHNRHKMDRAAMTKRIVSAMRKPQFKIWGHALGRYVLTRPPFDADVEAILDVIAESRAAVEVNGDPHRLDMAPRWIREARKRNLRFVISTDAHSVRAMQNFRWGVDMARRGGVRRNEVLNALPADDFRAAVRP
jgi:DNA polymerase (family 10)